MASRQPRKEYLGDGVYVDVEYDSIVLTAENGVVATDRIVLEIPVINALIDYYKRAKAEAGKEHSK